jgi:selenocysteine lyase/cysteine desulfurase
VAVTFGDSECERCRDDFPSLHRTHNEHPVTYFDGPAGTQVPRPVIDAVASYYQRCNANTHGRFVTSEESDRLILQTREAAAAFLGAASWREISFGANMTSLAYALSHALAEGRGSRSRSAA